MSIVNSLSDSFFAFLDSLSRHKSEKGMVLAYSGGPDSTVLLDLLSRSHFPVYPLYYAHYLRDKTEQEAELDFVRETVRKYGMKLRTAKAEPGEIEAGGRSGGIGIEAYARKVRYAALHAYREELDAGFIATAHTLDDNVETMILRFFQGMVLCSGIMAVNGSVIRPLLSSRKEHICEYIREKDLGYFIDSTNLQNCFLRNRVRNVLVPLLDDIFPSFQRSLVKAGEKNGELKDFFGQKATELLPWQYKADFCEVSVALFNSAPVYMRIHTLLNCIHALYPESELRIPGAFFDNMPREITCENVILSGHGILLRRQGNMLVMRKQENACKESFVHVLAEGETCQLGKMEYMLSSVSLDGWTILVSSGLHEGPWILRSRQPGDVIPGPRHMKKLKKLFNEWSIPEYIRNNVPVLSDRNGVLAVFAEPYGGKNQLSISLEKDTMLKNDNRTGFFLLLRGVR